ncbi:MAG: N-acetylneuraminate synthase [Bacteroidetes bacterium]|nr:N-acetylneuraminate synthase [Bacteroidota bacterium]
MQKVIIIAEAGVNHNGSLEIAKKLIDKAAEAGADYVKFQTFKAEKLVTKNTEKATYQKKNINIKDNSQFNMVKNLELTDFMHFELNNYCKTRKIKFLSSGFDESSIDFLDQMGMQLFKIPSGEITNYKYLRHVSKKGKPIYLSTGMSTLAEIDNAINVIINEGLKRDQITVLHCNSEYPTQYEDVNLKAMLTIQQAFKVKVGYSDHTLGIEIPIAAAALGACVIEKHFTLDRKMDGPDHIASIEPNELVAMIKAIRNIEKAIGGSGIKEPTITEMKNIELARKKVVAAKKILKGDFFNNSNICLKRSNDGLSAIYFDFLIGKKAPKDFDIDQGVEL